MALELEELALEQARLTFEQTEREKERKELRDGMENGRQLRREEREAQQKLELEKFKIMMEMFGRQEKK